MIFFTKFLKPTCHANPQTQNFFSFTTKMHWNHCLKKFITFSSATEDVVSDGLHTIVGLTAFFNSFPKIFYFLPYDFFSGAQRGLLFDLLLSRDWNYLTQSKKNVCKINHYLEIYDWSNFEPSLNNIWPSNRQKKIFYILCGPGCTVRRKKKIC